MKKLLLVLALCTLGLTSCNRQIIDFELDKFNYAHLVSANRCVKIKKWNNYKDGDMVQIILDNDTKMLGHSNEIILINGRCPYCYGV